jgi:uncharacterized protein
MESSNRLGGNRIVSIDRMRGFSLLGIFFVNMISFHSPLFDIDPLTWWEGPLNRTTYILIDVLVQASFYPLFAMLFGYGLVILRERTLEKNLKFYPLALRRLTILLVMGMIHAFLVWEGDILITYAVCGFAFLLFISWSAKRLLVAGLLIYIIPNLILLLMLGAAVLLEGSGELSLYDQEAANQAIALYQSGSFAEITEQRIAEWSENNGAFGFLFYFITIFPLFLIGAAAAKKRLFEKVELKKREMGSYAAVLAFFGLLLKLLPYIIDRNLMTDYLQDIFGGAMLAMVYALLIALISNNKKFDRMFAPLEATGRLSISNYLFQSLLSTLIFYNYGMGYYGKISLFAGCALALLIYSFQLAASSWWVARFHYGPVEWLWRIGTYWKWQPFKKEKLTGGRG